MQPDFNLNQSQQSITIITENKSEYEVSVDQGLYSQVMGYSIPNSATAWYEKYQTQSPFQCPDWNEFQDSNQMTYFKYVTEKMETSYLIQGLFDLTKSSLYYAELSSDWIEKIKLLYAPQIFPIHAMQMISSYIAQMAPHSRIVTCASFQSANDVARIQTISENIALVAECVKNVDSSTRNIWQTHQAYQPLRKLMEEALIVYDWGQSFVAMNLCIKPLLDELFLKSFSKEALVNSDYLTSKVTLTHFKDSEWQQSWSQELVQVVVKQNPDVIPIINVWIKDWTQKTLQSLDPFLYYFDLTEVKIEDLQAAHNEFLSKLELNFSLRI